MPSMVGRTLGALLMADRWRPRRASRGSISAATRMLVQGDFIERVRPPGERKDRFRVKPDAWHEPTRR